VRSHEQASPARARLAAAPLIGINLGCGLMPCAGWINCDVRPLPGVDLCCNILEGIPLADDFADYIAAIHLLQDLRYGDIVPALKDTRRVLKPAGVLRVAVPDLDKAIEAYRQRDAAYFYVPDEHARSLGAKLVTQLTWYGSVQTPFNFDFLEEVLEAAGFGRVRRCAYRVTRSRFPELVALDNRDRESLFVEAVK
jgi:predicted SAM-dependent methyltransferase